MQIITNLTNLLSHVENNPGIHHEITFVGNRPTDYEDTKTHKTDDEVGFFEEEGHVAW
jgi:hypothetical protein